MNIFLIIGLGCLLYFGIILLYIISENISYESYEKKHNIHNTIILLPLIIVSKIINLFNK